MLSPLTEPRCARNSAGLSERDLWPHGLIPYISPRLGAAHRSRSSNVSSRQMQPERTGSWNYSGRFCKPPVLISYSVAAGNSYFFFIRMLVLDWLRKQPLMLHTSYSPSKLCSVDMLHYLPFLLRKSAETAARILQLVAHVSPKLDQMKVGRIGTAAYYAKFFQRFECVITTHFKASVQQNVSCWWWWCNILKAKLIIDFEVMTTNACALTEY